MKKLSVSCPHCGSKISVSPVSDDNLSEFKSSLIKAGKKLHNESDPVPDPVRKKSLAEDWLGDYFGDGE